MKNWFVLFLLSGQIISLPLYANPTGGQVINGQAQINTVDELNTIIHQTSDQAWIDWQSFSIDQNGSVNFQLDNDNGLTVNRIIGNDLSEIHGQLNSNGTVFLINPNGVLFGEQSQIDVGGLFISDHQMNDDWQLTSNNNSQGIIILGQISSREQLNILANNISNAGELNANNINLQTSQGAFLQLDDQGLVTVLVPSNNSQGWIENTGAMVANDKILIGSPNKNQWLNQLYDEQNNIDISGELVANEIEIFGDDISLEDADFTAQLLEIESEHQTLISQSNINAQTQKIRGGEIQIINNSQIKTQGGEITIGGLFQGQVAQGQTAQDETSNNAKFVHIGNTVNINADGTENQNGGEVIIWSDDTTVFSGNISAKGGQQSGDGGFVEVSGKQTLVFRGDVNTSATNGKTGQLLLDPDVITIADGAGASADTDGVVLATDYANTDITIFEEDLEDLSAATSINLQADESIIINNLSDNALTLNQTGTVSFNVTNGNGEAKFEMLDINDAIEMTGGGNLSIYLFGNSAIGSGAQTAKMIVGDINMTAGGSVILQATSTGGGTTSDEITISVEDITVTGDGDLNFSINNTEDSDVGLTSLDVGNITITGSGNNNVLLQASNTNLGAAAAGTSTVNLNGNINVSGDGSVDHWVSVVVEEDGSQGGTLNSYGDILVPGGKITLSAGTWQILNSDGTAELNSMTNLAGGGSGIDLTDFGIGSINGNGHSLTIAGSGNHNLNWNEFTNVDFLFYKTDGNVDLGDAAGGTNITNAQLANLTGDANRLTIQTAGNITATNAVLATQTALRADTDSNGTGSVVLNGLITTDTQLTLSGADISGDGTATNAGTAGIIFDTNGNNDAISVNGAQTYNIENNVWNGLTTSATVTVEDSSHIIFGAGALGKNIILDGSSGTGVTIAGAAKTWAGANSVNIIGNAFIETDITMSNALSLLDIDGALTVGDSNAGAGETVTVEAIFDLAGTTNVDFAGDDGDTATLTHNDENFNLPTITTSNGTPDFWLRGKSNITTVGFDGGNANIRLDVDTLGVATWTSSGTNNLNNLFVRGETDDNVSLDGTWNLTGDVTTNLLGEFGFTTDNISANSFDFTGTSSINFGSGSAFQMTSTGGDITLVDMVADRRVNFDSFNNINLSAITTTDGMIELQGLDVTGDGSAIDLGTATIKFQAKSATPRISVGDAGAETYNIEANIWDNLSVGQITLDGFGNGDVITILEDTLPANLQVDGGNAQLIFDGGAKNYTGASISADANVYFLQDFSSDSLVTINKDITIGASNVSAGDSITITGDFDLNDAADLYILNDDGDNVTIDHNGSAALTLPNITTSNGNPLVTIDSDRSATMAGFEGGTLNVNIDSNNNSINYFNTTGTYLIDGLSITGTNNNDSVSIDGTWTVNGATIISNIDDITFLNDRFVVDGDLSLASSSSITLGSSNTAFDFGTTSGNLIFGDITGNRPLNVTAPGLINFQQINVASRALSITSDSDLTGDEGITGNFIQSGNLTMAGDFTWDFNPIISGDYIQTRGDVTISDASISAFDINFTSADSVTLAGADNSLTARSGDLSISILTDDGSNANLTVTATGSITSNNINTGTGNQTYDSNSDDSGNETLSITSISAGNLSLNDSANLSDTINVSTITTTSDVTLTDAAISIDQLDNSNWASTTLTGSNNSITANSGGITLANLTDDGSNADFIAIAQGAISANNVNTGTGNQSYNSDSDSIGVEEISLANSQGGQLTLSDSANFAGNISFTNVLGSNDLTLTDSSITFDNFDSSVFNAFNLSGTSNNITVNNGNLILSNATIALGSDLGLLVGAGNHQLHDLNVGSGDISINSVNGSINQLVTAEGDWVYNDLAINNITSFTNNANLNGNNSTSISVSDDIVLNDTSTIDSETVNLNAGDDITVTGISSDSLAVPSITITAGGDLLDGGNTNVDINANNEQSIDLNISGNSEDLELFFENDFDLNSGFENATTDVASISDQEVVTVEDESQSSDPVKSNQASVGQLPKNRLDLYTSQCNDENEECEDNNAINEFLNSLLIGGALPEG